MDFSAGGCEFKFDPGCIYFLIQTSIHADYQFAMN